MIKIFTILCITLVGYLYASSPMKNLPYFKKIKKHCAITALNFAHKHTQNEWENIKQAGKFKQEAKKICPKVTLKSIYANDIYSFVYEYANDSGKMPSL